MCLVIQDIDNNAVLDLFQDSSAVLTIKIAMTDARALLIPIFKFQTFPALAFVRLMLIHVLEPH
jgi:hypothetical protein